MVEAHQVYNLEPPLAASEIKKVLTKHGRPARRRHPPRPNPPCRRECHRYLSATAGLPPHPPQPKPSATTVSPTCCPRNIAMTVQKLTSQDINDFIELIQVFSQTFEIPDVEIPNKEYLNRLIANPDFWVFVVKFNGTVIGGLTVYILHGYYSEQPIAYIYDVGVLPEHQRKGAGKMLMKYLIEYCQNNYFKCAYVEAEADDFDAINFYNSTQPHSILNATHFTYNTDKSQQQEK